MVARAARGLVLLVALGAAQAGAADAGSVEGWGRVSVLGGYRWVPNWYFAGKAAEAGSPVSAPSIGGVMGSASFGYGAFPFLEVAIDAVVGYETFTLEGLQPFTSVSYGALLGSRFTRFDVLVKGLAPYLGVQFGPLLVNLSSPSLPQPEKLVGALMVSGGVSYRFADRFAFTLDARWLLARSFVNPIAGANAGGFTFSAGLTVFFAPTPKRDLDVPGF